MKCLKIKLQLCVNGNNLNYNHETDTEGNIGGDDAMCRMRGIQ